MKTTTILIVTVLAAIILGGGYLASRNNSSVEKVEVQPSVGDSAKSEETDEVPDKFIGDITIEQARTIAQNRRPGKTIEKIEQEVEEGVGVYSVRFTDSGRVDVNAVTGEIMRVEAGDGE
ncbi:MAG: PepSY domain-containing protein [Candidatus Berkelbacteria bacterium]|nr:MAG: PepSY domain-containing protein [Candidatus Berkelbacteria bacterium]QQG51813.1 MAG: PepSY domain-containing protein [Candidatus Berkelbacteria bacterium]